MNYINGCEYSCPRCKEFLFIKIRCWRCLPVMFADIRNIVSSCEPQMDSNISQYVNHIMLSKIYICTKIFAGENRPKLNKDFEHFRIRRLKIMEIFNNRTLKLTTTESLINAGCCHDVINIILSFYDQKAPEKSNK